MRRRLMNPSTRSLAILGACVLALVGAMAQTASAASLGQTTLPPSGEDGPVTVYYPSEAQEQSVSARPHDAAVGGRRPGALRQRPAAS